MNMYNLNCQNSQITDNDLKSMQMILNNVSLDISSCQNITDEGLQYLNNIAKLNLSFCKNITDEGLKYLNNVTDLNISSSNITGVKFSAAAFATIFPTATLPVKKIKSQRCESNFSEVSIPPSITST